MKPIMRKDLRMQKNTTRNTRMKPIARNGKNTMLRTMGTLTVLFAAMLPVTCS